MSDASGASRNRPDRPDGWDSADAGQSSHGVFGLSGGFVGEDGQQLEEADRSVFDDLAVGPRRGPEPVAGVPGRRSLGTLFHQLPLLT